MKIFANKYYIFEQIEEFFPTIIDSADNEALAKIKVHNYRKANQNQMKTFFCMKVIDY